MSNELAERTMTLFQQLAQEGLLVSDTGEDKGGIVTAFIAIIDYIDSEGKPAWTYVTAPNQALATSLGLAAVVEVGLKEDAREMWVEATDADG